MSETSVPSEPSSKGIVAFGVANVICASLVAFSVFSALPSRWWVVDSAAVLVISLLGGSGVGLRVAVRPTR